MSTTLPDTTASGGLENAATTQGQQKSNLSALRNFINDLFGSTTAALRTVWEAFRLHGGDTLANAALTFAVGSSALTITLKTRAGATPSATDPVLVSQRSATAGNGDFNLRAATAATSLVISSGSTLGHGNSDSSALYVYLIDNAGTPELAISKTWLGPSGIVSTTAEGGAGGADSGSTTYSTTSRSSVPFRALAKLTAPQTTAGTWAAVPTACQLWPFDPPSSATSDALIVVRDEKSSGTNGGGFTSGAWQVRDLNTEAVDTGSNCSLSSNQITLAAGTYRIRAQVPAYACGSHQAKLYNATDASDIILGTNDFASVGSVGHGYSIVEGRFTIAASKALEIRHRCTSTKATDGYGLAASWGTEVYTTVVLTKEA